MSATPAVVTPDVIELPARPLAVVHLQIAMADMMQLFPPAVAEVEAALKAQGIAATGPLFAHHARRPGPPPDGTFDFEVGFPTEREITPTGRVYPVHQLAQTALCKTYRGPYDGLWRAWTDFQQEVEATGKPYTPDFWEVYVTGPKDDLNPATWQTDLIRPLV